LLYLKRICLVPFFVCNIQTFFWESYTPSIPRNRA
jgi:hypothetical protein